jgi:hypothetical protein
MGDSSEDPGYWAVPVFKITPRCRRIFLTNEAFLSLLAYEYDVDLEDLYQDARVVPRHPLSVTPGIPSDFADLFTKMVYSPADFFSH